MFEKSLIRRPPRLENLSRPGSSRFWTELLGDLLGQLPELYSKGFAIASRLACSSGAHGFRWSQDSLKSLGIQGYPKSEVEASLSQFGNTLGQASVVRNPCCHHPAVLCKAVAPLILPHERQAIYSEQELCMVKAITFLVQGPCLRKLACDNVNYQKR